MRNSNKYHKYWKEKYRSEALILANFKCQNCGVVHKNCYIFEKGKKPVKVDEEEMKEAKKFGEKAYKVYLQVAHLDHDTTNNEMSNLKVLCPSCHLNNDREVNNIKRKSKIK